MDKENLSFGDLLEIFNQNIKRSFFKTVEAAWEDLNDPATFAQWNIDTPLKEKQKTLDSMIKQFEENEEYEKCNYCLQIKNRYLLS